MGELIRQQRHFLQLFVQTTPSQRKVLLQTVTKPQLKALSQIAHNIIRGNIPLNSTDKTPLKRDRRLIYLLGDKRLGFVHKKRLVQSKELTLYHLVSIALPYLEPVVK